MFYESGAFSYVTLRSPRLIKRKHPSLYITYTEQVSPRGALTMCKSEMKCKSYEEETSVEDKIGRLTRLMRHVRDMGDNPKKEDRILRERRMIQIMTELEDIKDDLITLVTGKVTPRQIQFLKDTESCEDADIDPSVQFFGVEWNSVFAKCFNLGLNIRIFKQRLTADCVDLGGLAVILQDLSEVRRQMEHHRLALESGALTPGHLARQLQQQQVVTAAAPPTLTQAKRYNRKHKTENLNRKMQQIETQEETRRRKSLSIPRSKKSTFMENVSSLLNYIKH